MPYYEENETYILAAILDPRFKLRWCLNDAEKQKSIDLLKSALERIIPQSPSVNAASQASEDIEPSPKKRKTLFNFMESDSETKSAKNTW